MALVADDRTDLDHQAVEKAFCAAALGDDDAARVNGGTPDFSADRVSFDDYDGSANGFADRSAIKLGDAARDTNPIVGGNDFGGNYTAPLAETDVSRVKPLDKQAEDELFALVSQPLADGLAIVSQQLAARKLAE